MRDSKSQAQQVLAELKADLNKLVEIHNSYRRSAEALSAAASGGSMQGRLMNATVQMQEMNQGSGLQQKQLAQKMQAQSRQFTTLANTMKTKYDIAKKTINNVR